MSSLIIILSIILFIQIILLILYYKGFFDIKPADLPPFKNFNYAIKPSLKKEAKKYYNQIIYTIFSVLNSQPKISDDIIKSGKLMDDINKELHPLFEKLSVKYTDEIKGQIIKYFVCKHIIVLLDNYYIGPNIYLNIPDIPNLKIRAFPFVYTAKRISGVKPLRGSTLAPFKYLVNNILIKNREKVSLLYDYLLRKYFRIINDAVAGLDEINNTSVYSINYSRIVEKNILVVQQDLLRIQRIFGPNISEFIKSILMENVLPLLNKYYTGPSINVTVPASIPSMPQLVSINFPNTDQNNIFSVKEGCLKGEKLETVNTGSFGFIKQCSKI